MTKHCPKCNSDKPIDDFSLDKSSKDGKQARCKQCHSEYRKNNIERIKEVDHQWYENNKDHVREFQEKYKPRKNELRNKRRAENPDKIIDSERKWRLANPEKVKDAAKKTYYKSVSTPEGRDKRRKYCKDYREANIERKRELNKKWADENRAKVRNCGKKWADANRDKIKEQYIRWKTSDPERLKNSYKKAREKRRSTPRGLLNIAIGKGMRNSLSNGAKRGCHWEALVGYRVEQLKIHIEKQFKIGMSWSNYGCWHIDHKIPVSVFNFETPEDIDFKRCWALKNLQPLWAKENLQKSSKIEKPFQPALSISV